MTADGPAGDALPDLRRTVYRVLASLFLEPSDERLAEAVTAVPELRSRLEPLGELTFFPMWEDLLQTLEGLTDEHVDDIREEHAGLFVAGVRGRSCPPYESAYAPGGALEAGAVASEIAATYLAVGLAPRTGEEPDHLAVELEFLSFLCGEEAASAPDSDAWRRLQRTFLDEHLLRWLPAFARDVRDTAPEGFYRRVAGAALRFVEDDGLMLEAHAGPEG